MAKNSSNIRKSKKKNWMLETKNKTEKSEEPGEQAARVGRETVTI